MRTVLVCGGRDYVRRDVLFSVLNSEHAQDPITLLIHGGMTGADSLAGDWARHVGVKWEAYPAYWRSEGKAAGPIRNARMLAEGKPDLVIAFPGNSGTADMVSKAMRAGVATHRISY